MKLNCLIRNTKIETSVRSAINGIVDFLVDSDIKPSFKEVYKTLKSEGLEIDMESVGALYVEETERYGSDFFTSEDEVADIVGAKIKQAQQEIVSRIKQEDGTIGESKIGDTAPEKTLANNVGKMFDRFINGALPQKTKSTMKAFEDLMKKAIVSSLPKIPKEAQKSITSSLDYFFAQEKDGFRTLKGSINNLQTLHEATRKEVAKYVEGITKNLSESEAEIIQAQWDSYTESIIDGTYDLMLGKGEQNKLLNESLKQIKIDGKSILDKNGNIQWSKLSESGNVDVVKRAISDLFQEGVKNQDGSVQKYTKEQADRIAQYLGTRYEQKLQAYVQRQQANERIKNQSPDNLALDFLKNEGYFGVGKKDGVLSVTKSDWKSFMNKLRADLNSINKNDVIKGIEDSFRKFLEERNDSLPSSEQLSDAIIDEKVKNFSELVLAKFAPSTSTPNALQRVVALTQLNNAKAFDKSTQQAINKLAGVDELDQQTLNRLKNISGIVQNVLSGSILSQSSSINPKISRAAYALQALSQLEREIKLILRESKMDRSGLVKALSFMSDNISTATLTLLLNPNNTMENITTAWASSALEGLMQFIFMPKQALKSQKSNSKIFGASFLSHVMGGSHTSTMTEEDLSIDIPLGEVYTLQNASRNIRLADNKVAQLIKEIAKSPMYLGQLFNRIALNSFDASFNSVLIKRQMMGNFYSFLKENGYTKEKALEIIDEALNIPESVQSEIDEEVKLIDAEMRKVGIVMTSADKALIALEMRNAQYDITLQKYMMNGATKQQVQEATQAMLKASGEVSKALTGKKKIDSKDAISRAIYALPQYMLNYQQRKFDDVAMYKEQGKYNRAALAQFMGETFGKNGIAKYVGGRANFAVLSFSAIPILGLAQVYGTKKAFDFFKLKNAQSQSMVNAESMDKLSKYYELQSTYRSIVARQIASLALTTAIVMAFAFDDDEEEGWFDEIMNNLMQTKYGQRFIAKVLPMQMAFTAILAYKVKDKKIGSKLKMTLDLFMNLMSQNETTYDYFVKDMQKAKSLEDVALAATKFLGSMYNANINQIEQLTRNGHVMKSALDKDYINVVKNDERIAKNIYEEMDTIGEAAVNNGFISSIMRLFSGKDYDRYDRKK